MNLKVLWRYHINTWNNQTSYLYYTYLLSPICYLIFIFCTVLSSLLSHEMATVKSGWCAILSNKLKQEIRSQTIVRMNRPQQFAHKLQKVKDILSTDQLTMLDSLQSNQIRQQLYKVKLKWYEKQLWPIWGNIVALVWRDWGTSQKTSFRNAHASGTVSLTEIL
jgi:hypothetical protein